MTSTKSRVAFQELTICKDMGTKAHDACSSTPDTMTEDDIEKLNAKLMKELN